MFMVFRFSFPVLRFSFVRFHRHPHLQSSDLLRCLVVPDKQVEDPVVATCRPICYDDAPSSTVRGAKVKPRPELNSAGRCDCLPRDGSGPVCRET